MLDWKEFERRCQGLSEIISSHLLRRTVENEGTPVRKASWPGQESKREPSEYKLRMLPLQQPARHEMVWKMLYNEINLYFLMATDMSTTEFYGLVVRVPSYRCRGPGFNFRPYQIYWEAVSLELGPFSLVSTTEKLLGRNNSDPGLKNREYGCRNPLHWPRDIFSPQELALTSPTRGGRSVGKVRSRNKATEVFNAIYASG
jgi:hypothetical protein